MHSLVDRIKEVSLRANGLRRKKWRYYKYTYTSGKWVDLFEITGSGVVDYLHLECPDYTSHCQFRVTFDDVVWEWTCSSVKDKKIFGEDVIYGVSKEDSYNKVWIPDLEENKITWLSSENLSHINVDSTGDDIKYYNHLPGGIRFNKNFKISVNCDNSYTITASALYGVY